MEEFRSAAVDAISSLGHEAITAEQFSANPNSPRIACLSGVRDANLVVLILGGRYGDIQASGISATHEEYADAKGQKPILAFVQRGVEREELQAAFVSEVEGWEGGHFRRSFSSAEELRREITQAIHRWELSAAVAPVDAAEILGRALATMEAEREGGHRRADRVLLNIAIAGGPTQQILRPAEIEQADLANSMLQEALFGSDPIFTTQERTNSELVSERLVLSQETGASVSVDESGSILISSPALGAERGFGVVIEEDVTAKLRSGLKYAAWLLERVDPSQKLSRLVVAAELNGTDYLAWRTRRQHEQSPNTITYGRGFGSRENQPVHLQPPDRARAALAFEVDRITEDLIALLRRQWSR
jgi:hypothetical protein